MTSRVIARSAVALSCFCASWLMGTLPVSAAEPYDLNVILSLTGGASFLGKAEQQAVKLPRRGPVRRAHRSLPSQDTPVEITRC